MAYIFKNDSQMWKLHRKLNFPNIFRLAAIYTWAPALKVVDRGQSASLLP